MRFRALAEAPAAFPLKSRLPLRRFGVCQKRPPNNTTTTTTTTIILRLFALICARVIQHVFPKPSIPALFVFDHTPLGVYLLYLPRVVGAAPRTQRGGGMVEGKTTRKGVGEGREEGRGKGGGGWRTKEISRRGGGETEREKVNKRTNQTDGSGGGL